MSFLVYLHRFASSQARVMTNTGKAETYVARSFFPSSKIFVTRLRPVNVLDTVYRTAPESTLTRSALHGLSGVITRLSAGATTAVLTSCGEICMRGRYGVFDTESHHLHATFLYSESPSLRPQLCCAKAYVGYLSIHGERSDVTRGGEDAVRERIAADSMSVDGPHFFTLRNQRETLVVA